MGSIRRELALTMNQKEGLLRDGAGLKEAADVVSGLKERYAKLGVSNAGGAYNPSLPTHLELGNTLEVAQVIISGALARQESRGVPLPYRLPQEGRCELVAPFQRLPRAAETAQP